MKTASAPGSGSTSRRDKSNRLGEEDAHRIAQGDGLLVRRAGHLEALERGAGQFDRGVQGQRRELLALRLLHGLGLALREFAQPAHQIVRVAPERESALHWAPFVDHP
jgi:hypothetical protein